MAEVQLRELVSAMGEQIEAAPTIRQAVQEAWFGRQPVLDGHLLDLERLSKVDLTTRVRRRPEAQWRLFADAEVVFLHFHGKSIELPASTWPAMFFIAEADSFGAADLPGKLDAAGRLTLIHSLIREGFLTICAEETATAPQQRQTH